MAQQEEFIPDISILSRYGLIDRMNDGFVDPPNRWAWEFNQLYDDWIAHGFFNVLPDRGYLTVSYDNSPYIDFIPTSNDNRLQVLALSCFLASCYVDSKANMYYEHRGYYDYNEFSATFEKQNNGNIIYTTDNGNVVCFCFDNTRPSQF